MLRIDSRALSARLAKLDLSQRKRLLSSLQEILPKPKRTKYMLSTLTEKQEAFICLDDCLEVLLGGAAGPGKSIGLFQAALQYVDVPGYAALLVRRSAPELYASGGLIEISKKYLAGTDAQWNGSTKRWTFPTGKQPSILEFQHYEAGIKGQQKKYGGTYQFIGVDEVTEFQENEYRFLFRSLRRPEDMDVPLRMRCASNPIGVGAPFIKQRFIVE